MAAYTSAGTQVFVSATLPATNNQAGYEALTWTAVGEFTSIGDYGDTYQDVTHDPMHSRRTQHKKGQKDGGTPNLDCARDESDAGQAILEAAAQSDCDIALKVLHNDVPCAGGVTPTAEYMQVLVMSDVSTGLGGPNNIDARSFALQVNSDIVKVPAA